MIIVGNLPKCMVILYNFNDIAMKFWCYPNKKHCREKNQAVRLLEKENSSARAFTDKFVIGRT